MKEQDRADYVDHILWHTRIVHELMTAKVDPMPEIHKIRAHLTIDDLNSIEKMREQKQKTDLEQRETDHDESEQKRLLHNKEALLEISCIINQFENRHILMSEDIYKRRANPTPEDRKRGKEIADKLLKECEEAAKWPGTPEEHERRLNL